MALPPRLRTAARRTLAILAVLCVAATGIAFLLTLEAGTLQLDGDYPTGAARLILSRLALVRFRGLVAHPNGGRYQVAFLWFLNAFGWEWPAAPSWDVSCGIVHNVNGLFPSDALALPADLAEAAARMGLSKEDWECLMPSPRGFCHNEFLAAWQAASLGPDSGPSSFSTAPALWLHYLVLAALLALALQELAIRRCPSMTRCGCPGAISARNLCPCLKEGEELTPAVRTRMRTWYLGFIAVAHVVASAVLLLKGALLVRFLRSLDDKIEGMAPELGTGYIKLSAASLVATLTAILCLRLRQHLEQNKPWMEDQGVDATTLTESAVASPSQERADESLI